MPITDDEIKRINELYHKQKSEEGLCEEEKAEQQALRQKYVESIRANLRSNLDSIRVKRPDGSLEPLKRKKK
ncbi:MAG: DUF896 domain-containing protein [Lachnospiraceae bacterium]|nr:DUF896 domain-containing protein [Lachnospiraceae bacterium]MBP5184272.1 DUF896 domain-containing protein [Lachnospiraceae bacterium]